jgi:anti-sigma regulatory factor (Ser/Thr protein kinase)
LVNLVPFIFCNDGDRVEQRFPAEASEASTARHWIEEFLTGSGVQSAQVEDAVLASGEAIVNVIEHAYTDNPGEMHICCYCCFGHAAIVVHVVDEGSMILREENRAGRGFGFHLMRELADDVNVRWNGGTRVTLLFLPLKAEVSIGRVLCDPRAPKRSGALLLCSRI